MSACSFSNKKNNNKKRKNVSYFDSISYDVVYVVTSFLADRDTNNLLTTCKYLDQYGKKYGYMKSIKVDYKTDLSQFIRMFCKHSQTLTHVEMIDIENPLIWLPSFVENMTFVNCVTPYNTFDPNVRQRPDKVKNLKIVRGRSNGILTINLAKFPNLKNIPF